MRPSDFPSHLRRELSAWLKGARQIVVVGIGNTLRCDDGVGVRVAASLRETLPEEVAVMECETAPESIVDEIVMLRPTHLLLVDAAMVDLPPGGFRLAGVDEVLNISSISTHAMPLRVFCDYVTQLTGADIRLLLVQPKVTDFGESLSPEVDGARMDIEKILTALLSEKRG
jgi:hydrogenase 3 maturation protease